MLTISLRNKNFFNFFQKTIDFVISLWYIKSVLSNSFKTSKYLYYFRVKFSNLSLKLTKEGTDGNNYLSLDREQKADGTKLKAR